MVEVTWAHVWILDFVWLVYESIFCQSRITFIAVSLYCVFRSGTVNLQPPSLPTIVLSFWDLLWFYVNLKIISLFDFFKEWEADFDWYCINLEIAFGSMVISTVNSTNPQARTPFHFLLSLSLQRFEVFSVDVSCFITLQQQTYREGGHRHTSTQSNRQIK